jgi:predicted TIM-barrel fold metal-dependent hydrolase
MITLADLEITDCHHHLWDLQANYYPWLTDRITTRVCGEYSAIRRDYLLEDFWRDAAEVNLVRSVHVQGEHDENDPVRETRWLQSVADDPASRGFPHGIVAYADFSKDNIRSVLEGHAQCPNIRGIRQMLHVSMVDPANPKPSMLEDPAWRRNFALIREFGLSFDLQVYFQQMHQAAGLVDEHPRVQFILCHMGQPARRDPESLRGWRDGLRLLAERPNVAAKISGGGMFDRQWTTDSLRPFVLDVIDAFGPARCLFASNFPVDGMMTGYTRLWQAYFDITAGFTNNERRAMFSGNARRIYRV